MPSGSKAINNNANLDTDKDVSSVVDDAKEIRQSRCIAICILILGLATSVAFLSLGILSLKEAEKINFERFAIDVYSKLHAALDYYVFAASIIHNRCRSRNFTRQDFRDLYEYVIADDLYVELIDFKPRVLRSEREIYENSTLEYLRLNYPHLNYTGFRGFNNETSTELEARNPSDAYYPVHYLEPLEGNERALDFDFYASGARRRVVDLCLQTGKPCISDRLHLVQDLDHNAYGVVLLHPGVNVSAQNDIWPRDLASIVVRIPDLLKRATLFQSVGSKVSLYDKIKDSNESAEFLGAIQVSAYLESDDVDVLVLPEVPFTEIKGSVWHKDFAFANKIWCLTIVPIDNTFKPKYVFVVLGGITMFIASVFLANNVHSRTYRIIKYNRMKCLSEMEKTSLVVDIAKKSAKSERELNDYIAHEVRNPVAAAMVACSFLVRTTSKDRSALDDGSWCVIRSDINIISNALNFINDLLRSMLDMHRARSHQLVVNLLPVDVLHDILEPVQSILYTHEKKVQVRIDCESDLVVTADKLRLKQVMLNLGRNSSKFVEEGFILLSAKKISNGVGR